jgi:hypothetical protein
MSLPGMAPQAGAGGLSEQEQKYVKIVRQLNHSTARVKH